MAKKSITLLEDRENISDHDYFVEVESIDAEGKVTKISKPVCINEFIQYHVTKELSYVSERVQEEKLSMKGLAIIVVSRLQDYARQIKDVYLEQKGKALGREFSEKYKNDTNFIVDDENFEGLEGEIIRNVQKLFPVKA